MDAQLTASVYDCVQCQVLFDMLRLGPHCYKLCRPLHVCPMTLILHTINWLLVPAHTPYNNTLHQVLLCYIKCCMACCHTTQVHLS